MGVDCKRLGELLRNNNLDIHEPLYIASCPVLLAYQDPPVVHPDFPFIGRKVQPSRICSRATITGDHVDNEYIAYLCFTLCRWVHVRISLRISSRATECLILEQVF